MILQGIYVVSWSSGFLRRNQNHADSYTDNFQFQEFLSGKEKTNWKGSNQNTKPKKFCWNYITKYHYEATQVWYELSYTNEKNVTCLTHSVFILIKFAKSKATKHCYYSNIPGYGDNLIMQNLTFEHYWFKRGTVCVSDSPLWTDRLSVVLSPPLIDWFSNFTVHGNHLPDLLKTLSWAPPPEFLIR